MLKKDYHINIEPNRLTFSTSSFSAEKSSVLHSGVYSREFASMLFASGVCIVTFMILKFSNINNMILRLALLIIIFIVVFIGANRFVFKKKLLNLIIDKSDMTIRITRSYLVRKKTEKFSIDQLKSIDVGHVKYEPQNIDGINFVQKISAQHGSAVPGLEDTEEYITLSLKLTDGSERTILASRLATDRINGETYIPLKELRSFLNLNDSVE